MSTYPSPAWAAARKAAANMDVFDLLEVLGRPWMDIHESDEVLPCILWEASRFYADHDEAHREGSHWDAGENALAIAAHVVGDAYLLTADESAEAVVQCMAGLAAALLRQKRLSPATRARLQQIKSMEEAMPEVQAAE